MTLERFKQNLGDRLNEVQGLQLRLRRARLVQLEAREALGLHRTQLGAIAKGANLRLRTRVALVVALGVAEVGLLAERD
jgi:hypothetical protein